MSLVTDVLEGYRLTLEASEELRSEGIGVTVTPSESTNTRQVYPLPRDKWVIITFKVSTKEQSDLVHQKCKELGWRGIKFDTSGQPGERDWEVDWSFSLTTPDGEWEKAGDEVEDIIDDWEKGQKPE